MCRTTETRTSGKPRLPTAGGSHLLPRHARGRQQCGVKRGDSPHPSCSATPARPELFSFESKASQHRAGAPRGYARRMQERAAFKCLVDVGAPHQDSLPGSLVHAPCCRRTLRRAVWTTAAPAKSCSSAACYCAASTASFSQPPDFWRSRTGAPPPRGTLACRQ